MFNQKSYRGPSSVLNWNEQEIFYTFQVLIFLVLRHVWRDRQTHLQPLPVSDLFQSQGQCGLSLGLGLVVGTSGCLSLLIKAKTWQWNFTQTLSFLKDWSGPSFGLLSLLVDIVELLTFLSTSVRNKQVEQVIERLLNRVFIGQYFCLKYRIRIR